MWSTHLIHIVCSCCPYWSGHWWPYVPGLECWCWQGCLLQFNFNLIGNHDALRWWKVASLWLEWHWFFSWLLSALVWASKHGDLRWVERCPRWSPRWPGLSSQTFYVQAVLGFKQCKCWIEKTKKCFKVFRLKFVDRFAHQRLIIWLILFWDVCAQLQSGSWHSKRRFACQYCGAVSYLLPGEPETLLYTAYGDDAAHRQTQLWQNLTGRFFHSFLWNN